MQQSLNSPDWRTTEPLQSRALAHDKTCCNLPPQEALARPPSVAVAFSSIHILARSASQVKFASESSSHCKRPWLGFERAGRQDRRSDETLYHRATERAAGVIANSPAVLDDLYQFHKLSLQRRVTAILTLTVTLLKPGAVRLRPLPEQLFPAVLSWL